MKFLLTLSFLLATLTSFCQTPAAKPADVKSMDSILAALYDVISGPAGATHDWDRMRSLFMADARMVGVVNRGATVRSVNMTVDDYITLSGPVIEKGGFSEKEIARKTDQFGSVVQIFSTYESRFKADDKKPFARGINSIQLFNDGARWWIVSIFWQDETKLNPLPDKYLHNGK